MNNARDILEHLLRLNRYDPNAKHPAGSPTKGRWVTLNVPAALMEKLDALLRGPSRQAAAQPVAWIRWEWNRSGSRSLVFEKPGELSLAEEATGVVYDPLYAAIFPAGEPIDMVLHCPKCGKQHFDVPDSNPDWCDGCTPDNCGIGCGSDVTGKWLNPPHRSHLCHHCGHVWRPADVPTNGVKAVKTKGKADSPIAGERSPGTGDAIARSKRILSLVDDYHERPTRDTRHALRSALMDEFEERSPPAGPSAARMRWMNSDGPLTASMDNVLAWRMGDACVQAYHKADDLIDRGLGLLHCLVKNGFDVTYRREPAQPKGGEQP